MRNRLLVVDSDPRSLRVLDVSLRGAGFDVDTAADGLQAWTAFETAAPDLIICDADSGGIDGFALCARVRGSDAGAQLPFVLLSSSRSREQKIRALEAGADDFLVKPAYINEVLTRVRALLQRRQRDAMVAEDNNAVLGDSPSSSGPARLGAPPFSGDLADISVVDLVQLIEHNGRSGIIHLRGPSGGLATVYFRSGKVIDAEAGRLSGLDALSRLFSWTAGTFEIEWKNIRRKDLIRRPPSELVLDGMQSLDAWNELRGQLGNPSAVFEVDYRLLAERLAEIPDEVNGILRLCDGVRTVLQVVEDSSMPDTEALTTLLRLREEGIVHDKAASGPVDGDGALTRPDGERDAGSAPFVGTASRSSRRAGTGSGPAQHSFHDRLEAETSPPPPAPETPRRTAPGLGQHIPLTDPTTADAIPERRNERSSDHNNIIQFPTPLLSAPEGSPPLAGRTNPTRVGFVPLSATAEPPVNAAAAPLPLPPSTIPEGNSMSMTLPLGRAHEAAQLREQVLREQSAPTDIPSPVVDGAAAPQDPASMTDTHRGFGPVPLAPVHKPSPAAGVPVEVLESKSGASGQSDLVSAPTRAPSAAPGEHAATPGRGGRSVSESAGASVSLAGETSARQADAREPSAGEMVPRPGDATVKISFPDHDISRREALNELGLPSRWRGFRLIVGALLVGASAAFAVNHLLGPKGGHDGETPAAPGAVAFAGPAASASPAPVPPPSGAVVVPVDDRAVRPSAPPAVDLPVPATVPPAEADPAAKPATAATGVPPHGNAPPTTTPANAVAAGDAPRNPEALVVAATPAAPLPTETPPNNGAHPPPTGDASPTGEKPASSGVKELAECRAAFARNRLREALTACNAAAAANPRSAEALTMLAHTELNRGRLARANELAEKAVAIEPDRADAYVIIGGVHQDSGQNREAKAAYRRYLELAPRGRYADELRSIVNGL